MRNPQIRTYFEARQAHSDVVSELREATKKLGDCELRGGGPQFGAVYGLTNGVVFCATSDMSSTFWRLRQDDVSIALATGAKKTELGPDWIEIVLFQSNWPKPDLQHWALRAYDYARSGR